MTKNLVEKLIPVNENDRDEWEEIKTEINSSQCQIFWDASSGLDIYPLVATALGKIPNFLSSQVQNAILVMSDYCPNYLSTLKDVYDKLDNGSVRILWKSQYGFEGFGSFTCNIDSSSGYAVNCEASIDQMIPFKLWTDSERDNFKKAYQYHPSTTNHPVPDKEWHLVYFLLRLTSGAGELFFPIVFVAAENLLVFEEIFRKYEIPIEGFFAVRVAGKSGSWDYTHDFNKGKLPVAIQNAPKSLRPKFWGLEKGKWGEALPRSFTDAGKISGLGYGGCTIFKTNWRK